MRNYVFYKAYITVNDVPMLMLQQYSGMEWVTFSTLYSFLVSVSTIAFVPWLLERSYRNDYHYPTTYKSKLALTATQNTIINLTYHQIISLFQNSPFYPS